MSLLDLTKSAAILLWGVALSCAPLLPQPVEAQGLIIRKGPAGGGGAPTPDILWWKMETGSGTSLTDSSSGGGGAGTTDAAWNGAGAGGSSTDALDFDGTAHDAATNASMTLGAPTALTVSLWINPDVLSGSQVLVEQSPVFFSNNHCILLMLSGSNLVVYFNDQGAATDHQETFPALSTASWQHVMVMIDVSTTTHNVRAWYDKVEQTGTVNSQGDTVADFSDQTWYVGARNSASLFYNGQMDDLRIYTGDQSANVTAIYDDLQ